MQSDLFRIYHHATCNLEPTANCKSYQGMRPFPCRAAKKLHALIIFHGLVCMCTLQTKAHRTQADIMRPVCMIACIHQLHLLHTEAAPCLGQRLRYFHEHTHTHNTPAAGQWLPCSCVSPALVSVQVHTMDTPAHHPPRHAHCKSDQMPKQISIIISSGAHK